MAGNKGLGRGLGALLGDFDEEIREKTPYKLLPIQKVEPNRNQPRQDFDEEELEALAESLSEHGIIQPLTVRELSSGYYQIIAGERRWRAAKLAGLHEVPAVIIEADDKKVMELGLIENLQREDLNPMEEAEGYLVLLTDHGMTQEEVAQRMGKSRPAIANALRLTSLPPEVREMLVDGSLTAGHGRAVLMVEGEAAQVAFAKELFRLGLSVRQAEAAAKKFKLEKKEKEPSKEDPNRIYIEAVEKDLSSRFGRKVSITSGKKKGRLELEFYSVDDLNALLDLLETVSPSLLKKEGDE